MTSELTLKTAFGLIAKSGANTSSEDLIQARDDLNLPGAQAAIEAIDGRRVTMLLKSGNDRDIEAIDVEMRTAKLDLDRRRAATEALGPLIADAREREAKAAIEQLGVETRDARVRAIEAYVELDKLALRITELIGTVRAAEADILDANSRFQAAGRSDLRVGLPMTELATVANSEGQFLPKIGLWSLNGYTDHPTTTLDGGAPPRWIVEDPGRRRLGRMAELLPATTNARPRREVEAH
ncbi:MAG: hypothetical protein ACKOEC_22040 [Acidimicrobiia bacterium]